jgi:hypothetical protein
MGFCPKIKVASTKNGRPRKIDQRHERKLVRLILTGKCSTATEIKKYIQNDSTLPKLSVSTCKRVLYRAGLRGRAKIKKPCLSKIHRQRRLLFARTHENWTIEEWKKVVWSDESKICIFNASGRQYCWRKIGEPIQDKHVIPTKKYGGGSFMVWGCMTWDGVGFLCKIDGTLNSELYQNILGDELIKTLEWYDMKKSDIILQHDNDPKQTSISTRKWIKKKKFNVLPWPSQSPDMNPMEHLWSELKRRINCRSKPPTSIEELWDIVQDEWNKIPVEFCQKLICSMPERVKDLRKAKGGFTRW